MLKSTLAVLDSKPFVIFFAVWTGVYLVQSWKGTAAKDVFSWIAVGIFAGILFI